MILPYQSQLELKLASPGIALIVICSEVSVKIEQPVIISIYNQTKDVKLITWNYKGHSECLKGFSIESSNQFSSGFQVLNDEYDIVNFYHHVSDLHFTGWYRIRAVDIWNRFGPYSNKVYSK